MTDLLREVIESAKSGGWDFFEKLPGEVAERVGLERAKSDEDQQMIARAWARFASEPDGARALDLLFKTTLRRTVFFINLNLPPEQAAAWGFFREGQNALAHEIARQIAKGELADPPEPRNVE